eukprot:Hpha_TRINITY_DN15674_c0_g1::TRINITY_DN15674_c0_g1_i1::g.98408::m.98408
MSIYPSTAGLVSYRREADFPTSVSTANRPIYFAPRPGGVELRLRSDHYFQTLRSLDDVYLQESLAAERKWTDKMRSLHENQHANIEEERAVRAALPQPVYHRSYSAYLDGAAAPRSIAA